MKIKDLNKKIIGSENYKPVLKEIRISKNYVLCETHKPLTTLKNANWYYVCQSNNLEKLEKMKNSKYRKMRKICGSNCYDNHFEIFNISLERNRKKLNESEIEK